MTLLISKVSDLINKKLKFDRKSDTKPFKSPWFQCIVLVLKPVFSVVYFEFHGTINMQKRHITGTGGAMKLYYRYVPNESLYPGAFNHVHNSIFILCDLCYLFLERVTYQLFIFIRNRPSKAVFALDFFFWEGFTETMVK